MWRNSSRSNWPKMGMSLTAILRRILRSEKLETAQLQNETFPRLGLKTYSSFFLVVSNESFPI